MEEMIITERERAIELDGKIKLYANMAYTSLMESAKCMKQMRDTKLYKAMGYETFEEYTVESLKIKERQAYTYIKAYEDLGERFLQANASLGITKLSLLASVPAPDRDGLVEQNDLAGMTVEEVKRLVAENDAKGEQIGLLTEEKAEGEKRIAELEAELEAEKGKPVEVAVKEPGEEEIQKIRDDAHKQAEKEFKAEKKKLNEAHKAEIDDIRQQAAREKETAAAEYAEKLKEIDTSKAEALIRAKELEKQLSVSSSPETVKFQFYFDELVSDFEKIIASIRTIQEKEPETAEKFKAAICRYSEMMKKALEELK